MGKRNYYKCHPIQDIPNAKCDAFFAKRDNQRPLRQKSLTYNEKRHTFHYSMFLGFGNFQISFAQSYKSHGAYEVISS